MIKFSKKYFLFFISILSCAICSAQKFELYSSDSIYENINDSLKDSINYNTQLEIAHSKTFPLDSTLAKKSKIPFFKYDTTFNKLRFYTVAGTTLISLASSYVYVNNAWWAYSKTSFHFDGGPNLSNIFDLGNDAVYAKGLDKFGHFFGGRISCDFFSNCVRWSGKSEKKSLLWGGIFGSAIEAIIEIKDGFSPNWGFSIYDLMAGSLGSFYPYFQYKSKFLKSVDIKFSYYKRNNYYFKNIGYTSDFQDDYMNQTYWFTFNPNRFNSNNNWPKWLGISLGFGVDDRLNNYYIGTAPYYADHGKGGYEFFIAPDIDFKGLLPKKPFWQSVAHILNFMKVPAPTLRLSYQSKIFPIYF